MTKAKKPESTPNLIENAIGERAKTTKDIPKITDKKEFKKFAAEQIPDEPSPSEMLSLEELNRQTVERLQDQYPEEELTPEEQRILTNQRVPTIPVSRPDLQPVTKNSSEESPPQKIEKVGLVDVEEIEKKGFGLKIFPAEDIELTALRKYILEDGFNEAAVAFHIVTLCSQPLVTTSTTTWAYQDRAKIPEMVLALLYKPGYIEGLWPSLKIIMGSNVGNAAWSSGVAMTIAFFDIIRMLPVLEEIKRCSETEQK